MRTRLVPHPVFQGYNQFVVEIDSASEAQAALDAAVEGAKGRYAFVQVLLAGEILEVRAKEEYVLHLVSGAGEILATKNCYDEIEGEG
jgi:hypothetical protein